MEEQIKRIASIELPTLELEGHRTILKQALMQKVIERNQRKRSFWVKFTGHISEIVFRIFSRVIPHKRTARVTLISGFSVAIAALILFTIVKPSFLVGPSDMVIAERLIKNSSQISSALGGANIALISFIEIKDHQADAIVTGTSGKSVNASVDLEKGTVAISMTFVQNYGLGPDITIAGITPLLTVDRQTPISDVDKEKAVNIARTDALSSMLFSEEAVITGVYQAHLNKLVFNFADANGKTLTFPNASTVEPGPDGSFVTFVPVVIEVTAAQGVQSVVVDLSTGKVVVIMQGVLPAAVPTPTLTTTP